MATYNKHYKEKLLMESLTYNPCLLISITPSIFGIVRMQTNNTLILLNLLFLELEEKELVFTAKLKEKLLPNTSLIFNSCVLI